MPSTRCSSRLAPSRSPLTALAIAATRADIICMQEVDNIEALKAFEYGYLFKMVGQGYRRSGLVVTRRARARGAA